MVAPGSLSSSMVELSECTISILLVCAEVLKKKTVKQKNNMTDFNGTNLHQK
jgi:hypothetical protein